jgi:glycosyltransferase involved in cell wall biosynthesis
MNKQKLVSVIIPTFNRAHSIRKAIESVLNQSYRNIELIVVDDGSTDNTETIVNEYGTQINYIKQINQGQSAARNTGLYKSNGVLIASLDSDDAWYPQFLEKCVQELESKQLDIVFTNWYQETQDGRWIDSFERYFFLDNYGNKKSNQEWIEIPYKELRVLYLQYCPSPSSSYVTKKELITSGWNTQMNIADDWCLLLNIILNKESKVAFTREKLWYKRRGYDNVCDGRDFIEIVKLLYIKDTRLLMQLYENKLSKKEYKLLKVVYIENLLKLGMHEIIREKRIKSGMHLIYSALNDSKRLCIIGLYNIAARKKKWIANKLSERKIKALNM